MECYLLVWQETAPNVVEWRIDWEVVLGELTDAHKEFVAFKRERMMTHFVGLFRRHQNNRWLWLNMEGFEPGPEWSFLAGGDRVKDVYVARFEILRLLDDLVVPVLQQQAKRRKKRIKI